MCSITEFSYELCCILGGVNTNRFFKNIQRYCTSKHLIRDKYLTFAFLICNKENYKEKLTKVCVRVRKYI